MMGVFRRNVSRMWLFALPCLILLFFVTPEIASANIFEDAGRFVAGVTIGTVTSPIAIVAWIILKIATLLLGLAGILFNWVMLVLVFEFARYLGNSEGMLLGWSILRDFANIGLLFGFLFLGVATILDLHSYPWKKTLPLLIIYAVLLNFSLFITEAVIDGANVLAATLYRSGFQVESCSAGAGQSNNEQNFFTCALNNGVAGAIMNAANVGSIFQVGGETGFLTAVGRQFTNPIGNILSFTVLALLVSIAAVVLFAASIMFISRAVVLAFLMITSPVGFAGLAIPGLKKLADDWWDKLIKQAFFAPIFLILLLVALKLTEGLSGLNGGQGLANAISSGAVNSGPLLLFALVIAFFIGALMLADRFGIYASEWATKTAGGLVYGTMGMAWRRTGGVLANRWAGQIRRSPWAGTLRGKVLTGVYDRAAKSSGDLRSLGLYKASVGSLVDLGKTSDIGKKGRIGELAAAAKREAESAEATEKARKAQDNQFKQTSDGLRKKADLMAARGKQATAEAEAEEGRLKTASETGTMTPEEFKAGEERVKNLKKDATAYAVEERYLRGEADRNDKSMRDAQLARLKPEERELEEFYASGGPTQEMRAVAEKRTAAGAATEAAEGELTEATRKLAEARNKAADLERAAVAAQNNFARTGGGAERVAAEEAERRYAAARNERELYEKNVETMRLRHETARNERDAFQKQYQEMQGVMRDKGGTMRAPKYALTQHAEELDALAQTLVGAVLDRAKLRAGRDGIYSEAGKDPREKAFEHFLHEMEHGAHASGGGAASKASKKEKSKEADSHGASAPH